MEATLTGTVAEPVVVLRFPRHATHPVTGKSLLDWVRSLPGRRWSNEDSAWHVTAFGPHPGEVLYEAGFTEYDVEIDPPVEVDDLVAPLVTFDPERPRNVQVWPRLGGYDAGRKLLGGRGTWQRGANHWLVPIDTFVTKPPKGILISERARKALAERGADSDAIAGAAAALAAAKGVTEVDDPDAVIEATGDIPEWFGLDLDPYQVAGALAIAAGHTALCDSMGLGKTRQALAAAAIVGSRRTIVVCPPVVLTAWEREFVASGLASRCGGLAPPIATEASPDADSLPDRNDDSVEYTDPIVVIQAKRKVPEIPDAGAVIVPDTLLGARPGLVDDLIAWNPDVILVDEAHRAKTWTAKRSKAVRRLAACSGMMSVAITGTPLFANPIELASPLAIAGHLDSTFGGYSRFVNAFTRRNHFNQMVPRKRELPKLRRLLDEHVWVRRTKADVLADMPAKSRRPQFVDIDPSLYRKAHSEVIAEIDEWLNEHGDIPSVSEIQEWCRSSVGMITRLRRAAGLSKVPIATEMIAEWVESDTSEVIDGKRIYDRPLIVWTHHREVSEALAKAVPESVGAARSILGGTPADERSELVDAFQRGEIPVLVCSIHAAGVGITLTRSSDAIFVETDWTPALVAQAEDRIHRRGQNSAVTITTLIAPDTLDERVQATLNRKAEILDAILTGADNDVAVLDADADNTIAPAEILESLVDERIAARRSKRGGNKVA